MTKKIVVEQIGTVLIARFADPSNRNAMTRELRLELEAVVDGFAEDATARCLLVTGEGEFFCVGGDVRSFTEASTPGGNRARLANSHRLVAKMLKLEKPIVTAVNGPAVGAGFGLAMIGDITIASERAFFQPAFSAIGLAADWGLAKTLPRAVGEKRAMDILMTNPRITSADALQSGMISRLHTDGELQDKALELASKLGAGATLAHGLTKTLVRVADHLPMNDFLSMEAAFQAVAMGSEDHREGVQAFLEKRKSTFKGM